MFSMAAHLPGSPLKKRNDIMVMKPSQATYQRPGIDRKLTAEEWNILNAFWDHRLFVTSRYVAIAISLFALVVMATSLLLGDWYVAKGTVIYNSGKLSSQIVKMLVFSSRRLSCLATLVEMILIL